MSVDRQSPKPPAAALAPVEHDALPAGTRFGEFEIIRVLGVGGFGIVYLAQDHSLERQVALKEYMPAALAARGAGPMITVRAGSFAETYAMGLRSFVNEARLLARFDHPSLVKVYRFWEDNGTAYMVMPYLQGRTLRDARRAMGQTPDEAWLRGVLAPVLDALELLHREGVFHRDIAPDNILLQPGAAPILLDFGAARRVISDRTQSLTAILKPSYAPIEQYAEMVTMRQGPWTDLYALGAVLHYLLFGVPPAPATARAVQPDAEQIEQRIVAGVSPRFMSVVAWMLGVRPLERPQNVASLRAALNGQVPVPSSVCHDMTVPGETASVPTGSASTGFAPTAPDAPFEATVRFGDSARRVEKGVDAARQTPAATPRATAIVVPLAVPILAPGSAPMRSTPPGRPPPSYVPPPRPPQPAPAESPTTVAPPRRGVMIGGAVAALAVAVGVLWQFIGVIDAPRAVALAPLAAASAAPLTAARASTNPPLAQVSSVPPRDDGAAVLPVAAPLSSNVIETAAETASSTATSARRARPKALAAHAGDSSADEGSTPSRDAPRQRAAMSTPKRAEALAAAGPSSAREACSTRRFIAHAICMDRECERPRFREAAECVRVLEVKRRRAER